MWMPSLAEHVRAAIGARPAVRTQADHREIGGAAAHVDHQHGFFALDRAFVIEGSRDRLELELDVAKAGSARARLKRGLRLGIARCVVVDEAHRPPEHHGIERRTGIGHGPFPQRPQIRA